MAWHSWQFAKRDVREVEILGRGVRWTEEELEYEARDKHRQAQLELLGLGEESKTVNCAAVKPEDIGQEEDANILDEVERKKFRRLAATLICMSFDRSDVQYDGESDTREVEETGEGSQRSERSGRSDVLVDSDWAKGPGRTSTSGGT